MRFTPNYRVSYKGCFFSAGQSFEIDPADREMMKQHGTIEYAFQKRKEPEAVEQMQVPEQQEIATQEVEEQKKPKKGGRPKKN